MQDQHFIVSLFSNPGDEIKKSENYGKNLSSTFRIRTLSPGLEKNNVLKCCFGIFPTNPDVYVYVRKLLLVRYIIKLILLHCC